MGTSLCFNVLSQARFIINPRENQSNSITGSYSNVIDVCWSPPPDGCFKINVDGSHISSSGSSACGGLIRDSGGNFVGLL